MEGEGEPLREAGSAGKGIYPQSWDLSSSPRMHLVEALGTLLPLNKQTCLSEPEKPTESCGDVAASFRGFPQNWTAPSHSLKPQGHLLSVSGHCFPFSAAGSWETRTPATAAFILGDLQPISECQDLSVPLPP